MLADELRIRVIVFQTAETRDFSYFESRDWGSSGMGSDGKLRCMFDLAPAETGG